MPYKNVKNIAKLFLPDSTPTDLLALEYIKTRLEQMLACVQTEINSFEESIQRKPASSTNIMDKPIDELEFTPSIVNCLKRVNIRSFGSLLAMSENDLMLVPNLGRRAGMHIKAQLKRHYVGENKDKNYLPLWSLFQHEQNILNMFRNFPTVREIRQISVEQLAELVELSGMNNTALEAILKIFKHHGIELKG